MAAVLMITALITALASAQEPKAPRRGGFGGGGGFGGPGGAGGSSAMLLGMPEVKTELGTSDEQNKKIEALLADLQEQMRASFGNFQELQSLSREERDKKMAEGRKKAEETSKKADEQVSKVLEPKQVERLSQLRLQREGVAAFSRADIAKQLGLTDEQGEKIRKIQEEARTEGRANRNLSEDERREFFTKQRERREKAQSDTLAVLTDVQKTKWTEMKGKEFKFPETRGGFGGGFGPGGGRGGPGGGGGGQSNEEKKRPERKKDA